MVHDQPQEVINIYYDENVSVIHKGIFVYDQAFRVSVLSDPKLLLRN